MIEDFVLISRDQKHLLPLLFFCFILRDRGHSLLPYVLFFIEDSGRADVYTYVGMCICMCVCVCVSRVFFLFSENSVIPSVLLHQQNEIRSPWDSNFLWLIYPAVIRASFSRTFVDSSVVYTCDLCLFPLCLHIALTTPRTFISRASLLASSVRFVGFYSLVYCSVKSS